VSKSIPSNRYSVELGGMDDRMLPEKGSAKLIENMQWVPEGYWELVSGATPVTAFTSGSGAISALHWFAPRPNQRWLITERRIGPVMSRIAYVDPVTGLPVTILNRRRLDSDDLGTQFLDMGRWVWMLSPIDGLVRWDGTRTSRVGFSGPAPAPTAKSEISGGPIEDQAGYEYNPVGDYQPNDINQRGLGERVIEPSTDAEPNRWVYVYGLTMVNDLAQRSPMSPVVVVVGANNLYNGYGRGCVELSVPRAPAHVRGWEVWRSINLVDVGIVGQGVPMYRLGAYPTAAPFDMLDMKPDNELVLGELYVEDEVGAVPEAPRCMATWGGVNWLAGMSENPHRVVHSTPGFPEQFAPINHIDIGSASTGPIVALHPVPRGLLVFKTGSVHIVKGNAVDGFRSDEISSRHGSSSPRAIVTVPGIGTLFLDPSAGPLAVVGSLDDDGQTTIVPIGKGIRKFWTRQAGLLLGQAVVVYDSARDEVWWQIPEGGNSVPSIGLVLHVGSMQWSVRPGWDIGAFESYRGKVWMGSTDDTDAPGVFVLTQGSRRLPNGDDLEGTYTTNPLRLDEDAWQIMRVEGIGLAMGEVSWEVSTRADRKVGNVVQSQTAPLLRHHSHDRDVWGKARWNADKRFTDPELTRFPVSVSTEMAFEHQVRIVSRDVRIARLDLIVNRAALSPAPTERR
jgi:hypothetical protein